MQVQAAVGIAEGASTDSALGPLDLACLEFGAHEGLAGGAEQVIAEQDSSADRCG